MRGARREHPRQWAVTDEQRSRWPGAAPPRRAGAVWLSGVVARSLQTAGGYARRSRLARQPNSRQQYRNLFLSRPYGESGCRWPSAAPLIIRKMTSTTLPERRWLRVLNHAFFFANVR